MSILNVEIIVKINNVLKYDFTPKGNRSLYYTRCDAEIVEFPKGDASIPKGKVIFTVFENTTDTSVDPLHQTYFKGGEILHLKAINYEQRSSSNSRYIPAEYIGQITANPKQLSENLIREAVVPKEEVKEVKVEAPKKVEDNAETIDLSVKIETLKNEIKTLEKQKEEVYCESTAAKYTAELDKKNAEMWKNQREANREAYNKLEAERRELCKEIDEAKKIAVESVEKTRIALVEELIKLLPIKREEIVKIQIDLRELQRGNQKAFLWTKKE